jgi:hypothetical protein
MLEELMSNGVSGTILEELQIRKENMFKDPDAFSEDCMRAADELKGILKEDKSLSSYKASSKDEAKSLELPQKIKEELDCLYGSIDTFEPSQIYQIIDHMKNYIHDLEYMAENKLAQKLTAESSSIMDKRLAHSLYVKLYKMYGHYLETIKILDPNIKLPTLKSLPGNYGAGPSPLKNYYFYFDDTPEDDPYTFYQTVIRKLGLSDKLHSFMDLMEYIEENPNCGVVVREKVS